MLGLKPHAGLTAPCTVLGRTATRGTDVEADSPGKWKDGLLGFFRDDKGDKYFILANLWHDKDSSASDRTLDFTIKFEPDVEKLYRLDRISGRAEPVELDNGAPRVRLPGGTGDLFKYTADPFPGSD